MSRPTRFFFTMLCLALLCGASVAHAGFETYLWPYGNALFRFSPTDGSLTVEDSQLSMGGSSAFSISKEDGTPLLFGAGPKLYLYGSSEHTLLASDLSIGTQAQAAAILPIRGQEGKYYVVHEGNDGLYTTYVDTTASTTEGMIPSGSKNQSVAGTHAAKALTIVDSADKRGTWIVSILGNEVDGKGFEAVYYDGETFTLRSISAPGSNANSLGQFSNFMLSPDGGKLVFGYRSGEAKAGVAIYAFDNSTGAITFIRNVDVESASVGAVGGVAFSADGRYAYIGYAASLSAAEFQQIDLQADPPTSVKIYASPSWYQVGCGQLAPDGNIYFSISDTNGIGIIKDSNQAYVDGTTGARYVKETNSLVGTLRPGLPVFNQSLLLKDVVVLSRDGSSVTATLDTGYVPEGSTATQYGFCWSKSADSTTPATGDCAGSASSDTSSATLTRSMSSDLEADVEYVIRPYAVIDGATEYYSPLRMTVSTPPTVDVSGSQTSAAPGATVSLKVAEVAGCTYQWEQTAGTAVAIGHASSPEASFTMPASGAVTVKVTLTKADGTSASDTVTVGSGPSAVIETASDVSNAGGVSLVASEHAGYTYEWTQTGGASVDIIDATSREASFDASELADGTELTFRLKVTDSEGATTTTTKTITVRNPPAVDVSGIVSRAKAGETVDLGVSAQAGCTYAWTKTLGADVAITGAATASASFTMPAGSSTMRFSVTATSAYGLETTKTVEITLDTVPVADAGSDQTVDEGDTVQLDASGSHDDDGDALTLTWSQTGGTAVTLGSTNSTASHFTAPAVGSGGETLTFQVKAEDAGGQSSTDTVLVAVSHVNQPPVADAGPDATYTVGDTASLNGGNSHDPEGGALAYAWTQLSGENASLSDATAAAPTFTVPASAEPLVFRLVVTDGGGLLGDDEVIVNAVVGGSGHEGPVADAGPDATATSGTRVVLNAFNSHAQGVGGYIASYAWKKISGPAVTLTGASSARASFTAPAASDGDVELVFQLKVTDDNGLSDSDEVVVNSTVSGGAPTANAGSDQTLAAGALCTLDGSSSAAQTGGYLASYRWRQVGGTSVVLSDVTAASPTFTVPMLASGGDSMVFRLRVTNGLGLTDSDTVIVNIDGAGGLTGPSAHPVSDVSGVVVEGDTVTLDATNSTAAGGATLSSYSWRQVSGPMAPLSNPGGAVTTFVCPSVDAADAVVFELSVRDSNNLESSSRLTVSFDARDDAENKIDDDYIEFDAYDSATKLGITTASGGTTEGAIVELKPVDPSTVSGAGAQPKSLTYGLIDFNVRVDSPGGSTQVVVSFPDAVPSGTGWAKFNSATSAWEDFSANVAYSADRKSATLTLVDGGAGDDDGLANGVIHDPSGPGAFSSSGGIGGSSSSSGGCTVAASPDGSVGMGLILLLVAAGALLLRRRVRGRF